MTEFRHPARILSDVEKTLKDTQNNFKQRRHRKLIKQARQLINAVLRTP